MKTNSKYHSNNGSKPCQRTIINKLPRFKDKHFFNIRKNRKRFCKDNMNLPKQIHHVHFTCDKSRLYGNSIFPNYLVNNCLRKLYLHLTEILMVKILENRTTFGKHIEF